MKAGKDKTSLNKLTQEKFKGVIFELFQDLMTKHSVKMDEKTLQDEICSKLAENFAVETKFLTRDYAEVDGAKAQAEQRVAKAKSQHCKPLSFAHFEAATMLTNSESAKQLLKNLFLCGLCECVVGKQLFCQECEKRYCEDCFNKIQFCQGKLCPNCDCKMSGLKPQKNKVLETLTENVFFKCQVCTESLPAAEAYTHFKEVCPQTEVTCTFNPAHTVKINKLQQHLLACPSRQVVCLVCKAQVDLSQAHDQNACRVSGLEKQLEVYRTLLAQYANIENVEESFRLHELGAR